MQNQNNDRNLGDIIAKESRQMGNIVKSCFTNPLETTLIDRETGEIIGHYKPETNSSVENPTFSKYLKVMYLIVKESFLHPTKTSYIDRDTLEVTRD